MNWVDSIVLAILFVSAVLGLMRGLVSEVMGIGAWVGAGLIALWGGPELEPRMVIWLGGSDWAAPVAYVVVFIVALVLLSIASGMVGGVVRGSSLGGVDRSLGVLFGLLRGAALVVAAYIAACLLVTPERWPDPVLHARTLPYTYDAANWLAGKIPPHYRPNVPPPPTGREARAVDLLHVPPQGRATARP